MMTPQEQLASFILHPDEWEIRIRDLKLGVDSSTGEVGYTISTARIKHLPEEGWVGEVINSRNGVSIT